MSSERPAPGEWPWTEAALWTLFLGPFFFLVWGVSDWVTSMRSNVGSFYFEWERSIPFVPLTIIPYLSLDLLFAGSTFLCGDRRELHLLVRRIVFAILISACGFLLFPLRFGFERPRTGGFLGQGFDLLDSAIGPYNLFPSLHISLSWILWDVYHRHTRGLLREGIGVWFVLITLSTLLGYQHHLIDVVGGVVVAALAFYLFPRQAPGSIEPKARHLKIASQYAVLGLVVLGLALAAWPWGGMLVWPALALAIAAAAYCGEGPSAFRKHGGRLPLSAKIVLAPFLLGQYLSLWHYRRHCRPWDEVVPGVWIGRKLSHSEARQAIGQGITAVVDLTAEFSEAAPFLAGHYLNLPVLDLTAPTRGQLEEAAAFMQQHSRRGKVYVHCKIGYSRSAAAIGAYLLKSGYAETAEEAVEVIRRARPSLIVRPEILDALQGLQTGSSNHSHRPSGGRTALKVGQADGDADRSAETIGCELR